VPEGTPSVVTRADSGQVHWRWRDHAGGEQRSPQKRRAQPPEQIAGPHQHQPPPGSDGGELVVAVGVEGRILDSFLLAGLCRVWIESWWFK
jgi:hypothetical protein